MGSCGSASKKQITEESLSLPSYSSSLEKIFTSFNSKYNLLLNIPLYDFQLFLFNLTYSTQSKGINSIFNDETDIDNCTVFLRNTIASHPLFYDEKDEKVTQIFMEYIQKLLTYIQKGAKSFMMKKSIEYDSSTVKKFYMLIIGLLFCYSDNLSKVETLFSWICNDSNVIERNSNIELFFYLLIFTPTYANFLTCIDMQKNYDESLPTIKLEEKDKYSAYFQPKTIDEIYDEFMKGLFNEDNNNNNEGDGCLITRDIYLNKIITQQFAWILTDKGIRSKLFI